MELLDDVIDSLLAKDEKEVEASGLREWMLQGSLFYVICFLSVLTISLAGMKLGFGGEFLSDCYLKYALPGIQVDDSATTSVTDASISLSSPSSPLRSVIFRSSSDFTLAPEIRNKEDEVGPVFSGKPAATVGEVQALCRDVHEDHKQAAAHTQAAGADASTDPTADTEKFAQNTTKLTDQSCILTTENAASKSSNQTQNPVNLFQKVCTFSVDPSGSEMRPGNVHITRGEKNVISESSNMVKRANFKECLSLVRAAAESNSNIKKSELFIVDTDTLNQSKPKISSQQKMGRSSDTLKSDKRLKFASSSSVSRVSEFTKQSYKENQSATGVKAVCTHYPRSRFGGFIIPSHHPTSPRKKIGNENGDADSISNKIRQTFTSPLRSKRQMHITKNDKETFCLRNTVVAPPQNNLYHTGFSDYFLRKGLKERFPRQKTTGIGSNWLWSKLNSAHPSFHENCSPKTSFSSPSLSYSSAQHKETQMKNKSSYTERLVHAEVNLDDGSTGLFRNRPMCLNKHRHSAVDKNVFNLMSQKHKHVQETPIQCNEYTDYHFGLRHITMQPRQQTLCSQYNKRDLLDEAKMYPVFPSVKHREQLFNIRPHLLSTGPELHARNYIPQSWKKMGISTTHLDDSTTSSSSSLYRELGNIASHKFVSNRLETSHSERKDSKGILYQPGKVETKSSWSTIATSSRKSSSPENISLTFENLKLSNEIKVEAQRLAATKGMNSLGTNLSRSKSRLPVPVRQHLRRNKISGSEGKDFRHKGQNHDVRQFGESTKDGELKDDMSPTRVEKPTDVESSRLPPKSSQSRMNPFLIYDNSPKRKEAITLDHLSGKTSFVTTDNAKEKVAFSPQDKSQALLLLRRSEKNMSSPARSPTDTVLRSRADSEETVERVNLNPRLNSDFGEAFTAYIDRPGKWQAYQNMSTPTHYRPHGQALKQTSSHKQRKGPPNIETGKQSTGQSKN